MRYSLVMNFAPFAETVLDLREQDGVRSISTDRARFKKHLLESSIASKPIAAIRPLDIAGLARALAQKNADDRRGTRKLSHKTVKKILQLTSTVFDHAVVHGLREDNPCTVVKMRRKVENVTDSWNILSAEEIHAIETCNQIPEEAKCLILFAIGTGLRQGEQFALRLQDVCGVSAGELPSTGPSTLPKSPSTASPSVTVRFGSLGLPPKNGRIRRIPLFGLAMRSLSRWLAIRPESSSNLVFPTSSGARRQPGAPDDFSRWLQAAGITRHVRWHDLRHTCATCLLSGVWGHRWNLVDIRDFLGHSSIQVTEVYAHNNDGMQRAAALTGGI